MSNQGELITTPEKLAGDLRNVLMWEELHIGCISAGILRQVIAALDGAELVAYEGTQPGWNRDMSFTVFVSEADDVSNPHPLYSFKGNPDGNHI